MKHTTDTFDTDGGTTEKVGNKKWIEKQEKCKP